MSESLVSGGFFFFFFLFLSFLPSMNSLLKEKRKKGKNDESLTQSFRGQLVPPPPLFPLPCLRSRSVTRSKRRLKGGKEKSQHLLPPQGAYISLVPFASSVLLPPFSPHPLHSICPSFKSISAS
ncbi:hypothetical protein IE53DRAFT_27118 [Violaceomyces palustris]|uniref:Uncharacterized protein n=1 Tax=Violaceomyces palustris TaxID=1673888 RepID=A0ACD0P1Q6_9BASI|nr:hypothetical protein IE53DRAFT_27118 [Violaceomyces palustris]